MDDPRIQLLPAHEAEKVCAMAAFSAAYPGFQGHFPGEPILPGFLHLQLALDVLALAGRLSGTLRAVPSAKFMMPITPQRNILVELKNESPDTWACLLSADGTTVSSFVLQL